MDKKFKNPQKNSRWKQFWAKHPKLNTTIKWTSAVISVLYAGRVARTPIPFTVDVPTNAPVAVKLRNPLKIKIPPAAMVKVYNDVWDSDNPKNLKQVISVPREDGPPIDFQYVKIKSNCPA
jgi:hypothetical protein